MSEGTRAVSEGTRPVSEGTRPVNESRLHASSGAPLVVVAPSAAEIPIGRGAWRGVVVPAGLGRAPQRDSVARLLTAVAGARRVVLTGGCGALTTSARPGWLVIPETVMRADGRSVAQDEALRAELLEASRALGPAIAVDGGVLCESRSVVDAADERERLHRERGAAFVDMESATWGEALLDRGLAWAVLRFVTDAPGSRLDWLARLTGGFENATPARVVLGLVRRPASAPKVVALGRLVRRARRDVGDVIGRLG